MPATVSALVRRAERNCCPGCDADEVVTNLDGYILTLSERKVPRNVVSSKIIDFEVDELAQRTRIKLWKASLREPIRNPWAYARSITRTEVADMVRRYRKENLLPVDDLDNPDQRQYCFISDLVEQDPADEYEQSEAASSCVELVVEGVLLLPPRQQYAMLCILKEVQNDVPQLEDALLIHGLNLEAVRWPEGEDEMRSLRASGSIARKKLMEHLRTRKTSEERAYQSARPTEGTSLILLR
jgi:Sigma-70 region 2